MYCDTGFSLLGLADLTVSQTVNSSMVVQNWGELLKRDVFDVLGMNSSFFNTPPGMEGRLAVSNVQPIVAVREP